jgi:hypothetical protein
MSRGLGSRNRLLKQFFDELAHTSTVDGGKRLWLTQSEPKEISHCQRGIQAIGLIHRKTHVLAVTAQIGRDDLVSGSESAASINHKHNGIGLRNSAVRLLFHAGLEGRRPFTHSASIDDNELMVSLPALTVLAVTGKTGEVRNQRITTVCQAIEQRRLAHVWATHYSDYGFHLGLHKGELEGF